MGCASVYSSNSTFVSPLKFCTAYSLPYLQIISPSVLFLLFYRYVVKYILADCCSVQCRTPPYYSIPAVRYVRYGGGPGLLFFCHIPYSLELAVMRIHCFSGGTLCTAGSAVAHRVELPIQECSLYVPCCTVLYRTPDSVATCCTELQSK
jgi:hypothetical protein